MNLQQQANARQLFTHADALGLKLPRPVLEARAMVEKIRVSAEKIPAQNIGGIAAAVADALGRDADPFDDAEVARAVAHHVIHGPGVLANVLEAPVMRLWEACHEYRDDIVAELRSPFDKAAAVLVVAHERIGDLDLRTDSEAILKKGGNIAKLWAEAVEADKQIGSVVITWVSLSQFNHPEPIDRRWLNLRIINPPADVWDELDLGLRKLTPWDAVRAGLELTLPTLAEYTERRDAIVEQRAELEAAASEPHKRPSYVV